MITSLNCPFDSLASPLFKNSWLDPPKTSNLDLEMVLMCEEQDYRYPPKHSVSTLISNENHSDQGNENPFGHCKVKTKEPEWEVAVTQNYPSIEVSLLADPPTKAALKKNPHFGDFDLEASVRNLLTCSGEFSDFERRRFAAILNSKPKKPAEMNRRASIRKYLEKKKRRKYVCQVKYKIRQDLACQRLRVKGKFVKSSKMDLIAAANILLSGFLTRRKKDHEPQGRST